MNLPLEYNKLSEYFDALGSSSPDSINRSIGKILKQYKIKTVLDLTCGTGSQVLWLAKHGYQVTGSDLSPNLLKISKSKAQKEKIKVKLLEGDMYTIRVGQFDAAITIFNAVGHLTKASFEKAMRNIHRNLNKGGLYIFDIFNLNSINANVLANMKIDVAKTVGNTKIHHVQYSKLNRNGHLTSYDYFSLQRGPNTPKV